KCCLSSYNSTDLIAEGRAIYNGVYRVAPSHDTLVPNRLLQKGRRGTPPPMTIPEPNPCSSTSLTPPPPDRAPTTPQQKPAFSHYPSLSPTLKSPTLSLPFSDKSTIDRLFRNLPLSLK
ncbi:unnamed protein product, partial [Pleuronectes platessa]